MQILLGIRGHYLQGDGEINALFLGIKGAQTPPGGGLSDDIVRVFKDGLIRVPKDRGSPTL